VVAGGWGTVVIDRSSSVVMGMSTPIVSTLGCTGTPRTMPMAKGSKRISCPASPSSSSPASAYTVVFPGTATI